MSFIVPDPKDPEAKLDYEFDWSAWLAKEGDTIVSYTLSAPDGIEVYDDTEQGGVIRYWLRGGTDGGRYPVTCHIVTDAGRENERTMIIPVKNL